MVSSGLEETDVERDLSMDDGGTEGSAETSVKWKSQLREGLV